MNDKPYFKDVCIYGDLYLDKVLLEYEFLSYSILKNNRDKFFVCYCYEIAKQQSWLINEVKINDLISFLLNKIDIKNIFLLGNKEKIIITRNYDTKKEKSISIYASKIIEMDILPYENEFLDAKEELYEYIIKMLYNSFFNIKSEFVDSKNDDFMIIHKKINNNIDSSNFIVYNENNDIDLGKSVAVSVYKYSSFYNILESKLKESKNYAKAT